MVVIEYRIVVPFTLEEFYRGLRFLDGRQRKEISKNSANGEQIDTLQHFSFKDQNESPKIIQDKGRIPNRGILAKTGTFTENRIYLGSRFPAWMRSLIPTAGLYVREKYYNCYPYSFCSYHSELFPEGMDFTIESLHVEHDIGQNDNIFGDCTEKEKKEMKLQIVDITKPVESTAGVFQGDPTNFKCHVSGRGPLPKTVDEDKATSAPKKYWFQQWIEDHKFKRGSLMSSSGSNWPFSENKKPFSSFFGTTTSTDDRDVDSSSNLSEEEKLAKKAQERYENFIRQNEHPPHLCIYKRSKVHIHNLPFSSSIEEATQDSTVRDLAVHSFRNLFCWLPEWQHMTHEDITKYLNEEGGPSEKHEQKK